VNNTPQSATNSLDRRSTNKDGGSRKNLISLHSKTTGLATTSTALSRQPGCFIKRAMDLAISVPFVMFILPVLCVFIKMIHAFQSRGPLFYKQVRCGRDNKPFTIFKFRTMDVPDEGVCEIENAIARIFPLGRLLRASKADEFPQFLNVLLGSMSIVGPRPHHFDDCEQFGQVVEDYSKRTIAKPGITGLAQYTEYCGVFEWNCVESRVAGDLEYIQDWSAWGDVKLILNTGLVLLRRILAGLVRQQRRWKRPIVEPTEVTPVLPSANDQQMPADSEQPATVRRAA